MAKPKHPIRIQTDENSKYLDQIAGEADELLEYNEMDNIVQYPEDYTHSDFKTYHERYVKSVLKIKELASKLVMPHMMEPHEFSE